VWSGVGEDAVAGLCNNPHEEENGHLCFWSVVDISKRASETTGRGCADVRRHSIVCSPLPYLHVLHAPH
jgi:hypothetical protein